MKLKPYLISVGLAALAVFVSLVVFDEALGKKAYTVARFDKTFRLVNYSDSPFIQKQFLNYLFSADICKPEKKLILILGSSETGGNYEPYEYSPTFYLNRLLPKDVEAYNLSVSGYFLHSQFVFQNLLLQKMNNQCDVALIFGINQRTYSTELDAKELDFYGNFYTEKFSATPASFRNYRDRVGGVRFSNIVGLMDFLNRPYRGNPRENFLSFFKMWNAKTADDRYFKPSLIRPYFRTDRWYERKQNECENTDVSRLIEKSRQREILDALVSQARKQNVSYYFYLHPHSRFPSGKCPKLENNVQKFAEVYPESERINLSLFSSEDYADGWHFTEAGNEKIAREWYRILKAHHEI